MNKAWTEQQIRKVVEAVDSEYQQSLLDDIKVILSCLPDGFEFDPTTWIVHSDYSTGHGNPTASWEIVFNEKRDMVMLKRREF